MNDIKFYNEINKMNNDMMLLELYEKHIFVSRCGSNAIAEILEYYSSRLIKNLNFMKKNNRNNVLKSVRKLFSYDTYLHTRQYVQANHYGILQSFSKRTIKNFILKLNINYRFFTRSGFNAFRDVLNHICQTILMKLQDVTRIFFNSETIDSFVVGQTTFRF